VSSTAELIEALVERAPPVRRLRPPLVRAALWLGLAVLILALLAIWHGVRPDFEERLGQPDFVLGIGSALATGVLAAIAAFLLMVPDRSRWWALLPAPALALWATTIGHQCLTDWVNVGPQGLRLGDTAGCFAIIAVASVPIAVALAVMLRTAALLNARGVAMTAGLAVAAITAAAHSLLHAHDASVLILAWNIGTAGLITAVGGLFGGHALRWTAARIAPTSDVWPPSREPGPVPS
jgi:hypothetical protein